MDSTITALAALAQETRLNAFRELVKAHAPNPTEGGLSAGDLADALGVPAPTLSFHLKEMSHADLVTSRKEGRSIIYRANLDTISSVVSFLLEDCCGGACGSTTPMAAR